MTSLNHLSRREEAELIYQSGIKRRARPLERLKARYHNFQSSSASSSTSLPSSARTTSAKSTNTLQRNPARNHGGQAKSPSSSTSPTGAAIYPVSLNSTPESRYAHMLAPPDPGKRPEKMRFNFSLLFTDEGVEYCIQEARARSMGLLGKKWGPPVCESTNAASSSTSLVPVDFNDDGQRSTRLMTLGGRRRSVLGGAEPTVTINTKEALADVFGMYNSPEKTSKLAVPGSKYAPLKKIEPTTPVIHQISVLNPESENAVQSSKTPTPGTFPVLPTNPMLRNLTQPSDRLSTRIHNQRARHPAQQRYVQSHTHRSCNCIVSSLLLLWILNRTKRL
jgi:checkpoint serine/threonine-protein kinase